MTQYFYLKIPSAILLVSISFFAINILSCAHSSIKSDDRIINLPTSEKEIFVMKSMETTINEPGVRIPGETDNFLAGISSIYHNRRFPSALTKTVKTADLFPLPSRNIGDIQTYPYLTSEEWLKINFIDRRSMGNPIPEMQKLLDISCSPSISNNCFKFTKNGNSYFLIFVNRRGPIGSEIPLGAYIYTTPPVNYFGFDAQHQDTTFIATVYVENVINFINNNCRFPTNPPNPQEYFIKSLFSQALTWYSASHELIHAFIGAGQRFWYLNNYGDDEHDIHSIPEIDYSSNCIQGSDGTCICVMNSLNLLQIQDWLDYYFNSAQGTNYTLTTCDRHSGAIYYELLKPR